MVTGYPWKQCWRKGRVRSVGSWMEGVGGGGGQESKMHRIGEGQ